MGQTRQGKRQVLEHLVKEVNLENLTGPIIVSNTLKGQCVGCSGLFWTIADLQPTEHLHPTLNPLFLLKNKICKKALSRASVWFVHGGLCGSHAPSIDIQDSF